MESIFKHAGSAQRGDIGDQLCAVFEVVTRGVAPIGHTFRILAPKPSIPSLLRSLYSSLIARTTYYCDHLVRGRCS